MTNIPFKIPLPHCPSKHLKTEQIEVFDSIFIEWRKMEFLKCKAWKAKPHNVKEQEFIVGNALKIMIMVNGISICVLIMANTTKEGEEYGKDK
jgi:hypothetical protein